MDFSSIDPDRMHFIYGGIFSQWWKSDFVWNGHTFNTAEQYMMYGKAMAFNDQDTAAKILVATDPRVQKALGREVKGYTDKEWKGRDYNTVWFGTMLKFSQDPELMEQMNAFKDVDLFVEASPSDKKWGIGLGLKSTTLLDISTWKGGNLLGVAITEVRNMFRQHGILE